MGNNIRQEMINLVNQSWEEDVLINDAFGEEFSLNNLLTFQPNIYSPVVENENQTPSGDQSELINQHEPPDLGANLSNFRYPSISPIPHFLLPPENPLNEQFDASHIPIPPSTSLEEVVERNLFEVSRKGKMPMPLEKDLVNYWISLKLCPPLKLILVKCSEIFVLYGKQLKK